MIPNEEKAAHPFHSHKDQEELQYKILDIGKPTESEQEVRSGRNKERSVLEKGQSQSGERDNLRRSARLKAQKPKDVMST